MEKVLIYALMVIWNTLVFGTLTWLVFFHDASPWWFLLAFVVMLIPSSKDDE